MRYKYQLLQREWSHHSYQRRYKKDHRRLKTTRVHAEYQIYGLNQLFANISKMLNKTSKPDKYPEDVHLGTLNPLAKPPKKNEKLSVRTITQLSPLKNILTITISDRCFVKMKKHIPLAQAAYQSSRFTAKQVFAIKILAEKLMIFENYVIFLILLDMSKAFATVD